MFKNIARHINNQNLVALIGAGVSRSWIDPDTGRSWPGLPAASDVVAEIAKIQGKGAELTFPEACFMYKRDHGRPSLERLLLDSLDRGTIQPLPAHSLLAGFSLPMYLTANYDTLLERAIENSGGRPVVVVEDTDVSLLQPRLTPVIKFHGCVKRASSIVAALDEYSRLDLEHPVVSALLMAMLANRAVLFVGYSLQDQDFNDAYNLVSQVMGQYMPSAYAIVHAASEFQRAYWEAKGVKIIESDLTIALRTINRERLALRSAHRLDGGDWNSNPFFESLRLIGTKPTETQVIEAFLEHLLDLLDQGQVPIIDIIDSANEARTLVLKNRPNFIAFSKVTAQVLSEISDKEDPLGILRKFMHGRDEVNINLSTTAHAVPKAASIGIYSQSVRVQQFLSGVPRNTQSSCRLLIGECRPKSPISFKDAIGFASALSGTSYSMTLVPDVVLMHMISNKQITHVVLGAHAVFTKSATPIAFVNTAGSSAIAALCKLHGIPLWIVADTDKLVEVEDEGDISYGEEEAIFSTLEPELTDLKSRGVHINALNVGYDLVPCGDGQRIITDTEVWQL